MTDIDTRRPDGPRFRRKPLWVTVAVLAVIGVAVGLALFQPWRIFTRNTVDEALPVAAAAQTPAVTPEVMTAAASEPGTTASAAPTPAVAAPPVEQVSPVEQVAPAAPPQPAPKTVSVTTEPMVLASGTFVDGEHSTSGTASVLQLPDGSRFIRLEGFSTSDGPDVHVWVTDQQAGGDDWGKYDDGRYIPLGSLKGTDGNQNYAIPADADLSGLSSVVIWCDGFNVAFGSAAVTL